MNESEIQPYQPIQVLDENIFTVDGEWFETAMRRRMTILRKKDGGLVIHNAIRFREKDYASIEALGRVDAIAVPNIFHASDAPVYAERFPQAKVFVPKVVLKKLSKAMKVNGSLEENWPYASEIAVVPFAGRLGESAFIHHASKTLVLTDLSFNMRSGDFKSSVERTAAKLINDMLDRFGPSRVCKWVFLDKKAAEEGLAKVCRFDFERIIVNHGHLVPANGKKILIEGFEHRYGKMDLGARG